MFLYETDGPYAFNFRIIAGAVWQCLDALKLVPMTVIHMSRFAKVMIKTQRSVQRIYRLTDHQGIHGAMRRSTACNHMRS